MSARRVRWECPNGIHPGVLGSTRPPLDSVTRYCLGCSEESGRLVKRTAPALERERAQKAATVDRRSRAKAERKREAERRKRVVEVREADGSIGELDVRETLERMMRMKVLRDHAQRACPYYSLTAPEVTLRRSRSKAYGTGHALYHSWRFTITVGVNPSRVVVEELLLHELLHLLTPGEHHNSRYLSLLCMAAREWWPGITVKPSDASSAYGVDSEIVRQATQPRLPLA